MSIIRYIIFVFKNRKEIQNQNWNIGAYERTLENHVRSIEKLLQTQIGDLRKYNRLTHKDCFNYETIEVKKSDITEVFESIQKLSCYQEKYCGEKQFIHSIRKYLFK